jgi:hypothetical protein
VQREHGEYDLRSCEAQLIRRLALWIVVLLCCCSGAVHAQNIEGQIIAAQYGIWRVQGIPQPTTGNAFNFVAQACSQIAGNKTFQPFQVGTPIEIFDADPNQNEAVTPSAVSATNQGCSITVTPAHTHNSFSLGSATAGLQEAINANTTTTGNTIVLTAAWWAHGGSSGIITSVQGTTALNLVDVTKAPYDWYFWNGSVYQKINFGGANLPHVTQVISGAGDGTGVGMPEKGTTVASGTGSVAWDEDVANGRFDCRNTAYAGGCLGPTPGLAMQAFSNALVCYQAITSKHASTVFPPGTIPVGTAASLTLNLPTGVYYRGASGNFTGTSTVFQATYNNKLAMHFENSLSATCADGNVHTSVLTSGRYEGFGEHGCAQGGCVNAPGDSGSYPVGGPLQDSILIEDSQGYVDLVGVSFNGGDGIQVAGQDTQVGHLWGQSNMYWRVQGKGVAGQVYNPLTDGAHANIMLTGLDNQNFGPFETYGILGTPGSEYGHVFGVLWGGGNTSFGYFFSNRDQIGLLRPLGNNSGRMVGGRIDGPMGEGILTTSGNNSFGSIENITACSGFSTAVKGALFGAYIATAGSGQTDGTYTAPAVGGGGTGGSLSIVVSGGKAVSGSLTPGSGYTTNPTFTLTGTGGTPATVGAFAYIHCDYIENAQGSNNYTSVHNSYDTFFGGNYSTGGVWDTGGSSTYDRGTSGSFEHITGASNIAKGATSHKDLLDPFSPNGGVAVTGPAVSFLGGNHFISGDSAPTSWSGPFTVESIMQDLWIASGNANTTLPANNGAGPWFTCSGYDLNLGTNPNKQYHFLVFRDDTFGLTFQFVEQCDTIDANHWWVNHLANLAGLPPLEQQGALDSLGDIRAHAIPAAAALGAQAGGTPGANGVGGTYTYAYRVWGVWGTQTSAAISINQCLPLPGFVNNPCFQTLIATYPEGTTHVQIFRETSTDGVATAGLINDVTFTSPQRPGQAVWPDTRIAPINASVIGSANYSANETGGVAGKCGTVPPVSAYPAVIGQMCDDPAGGFRYWADTDDHWKRTAATYANF